MLTGKQLVERGVITGKIDDTNIAQHGVDLNLIKVEKLSGGGFIPKEGKTLPSNKEEVLSGKMEVFGGKDVWILHPGVYDITFQQGCKVPSNKRLEIIQRSSMSRCGGFIRSAVFDAGFETNNMGTIIQINHTMTVEVGARVAQVVSYESNEVENLYDGQFQNDKQRGEVKK